MLEKSMKKEREIMPKLWSKEGVEWVVEKS